MRRLLIGLALALMGLSMSGCAKKDKVRIQLPFLDVRVKEDGSTYIKSPDAENNEKEKKQ